MAAFSLPQNEAQSMKIAPPEASKGNSVDGCVWGTQATEGSQPTCRFGKQRSPSSMVTIQQRVGCNTKCFVLKCIQGVKSRVSILLSASRWRISYQIFYPTPSTPCPRDPAMECGSRRTDHSPQKAFAHQSLELFNGLDMHENPPSRQNLTASGHEPRMTAKKLCCLITWTIQAFQNYPSVFSLGSPLLWSCGYIIFLDLQP